ncbi:MAG: ABC transporter ATP-binding protein [Candidatus Hodarchaeales archaeon]|jgi:ABC-type Fe3+/spermidine/putrescine transport system ATPase subunit
MAYFEIDNLTHKYEEQWVLEKISFTGREGELIAIVGPSGCGKTTILKIIVGILSPQQGSIRINSKDITNSPIESRNLGYVPQNQALFPHLSVFENIAFGLRAQKLGKDEIKAKVHDLAKLSELEDVLNRKPHEISGGQQQRVALLRALAPSPKLLLLDEPLSNIDTQLREQLAIYIRRLQNESNITTLFVTHDLEEAKMLADKIIVLNQGKILQEGSPVEITANPSSIEVAIALGLKNLYKVTSIGKNEESKTITLMSEIGGIEINIPDDYAFTPKIKGVYINPTLISIAKIPFNSKNSFEGKIISVIPEPMFNQVTLLVLVLSEFVEVNKNEIKIVRIHIPGSKCDYQISETVYVNIPTEGIKLYR